MSFPCEMTHYRSWVVWRYEQAKDRPKPTKIPYSPITGGKADSTNCAHWSTYADAVRFYNDHLDVFDGLGFVFSEQDPYTGIDIDDPGDDPAKQHMVLRTLEVFKNTYIERSPSKRAYHAILRGQLPNERKSGPIELYSTARYFTMTGDVVNDNPIIEQEYDLMNLWHALGGIKAQLAVITEGSPEQYSDTDIYNMGCAAQGPRNPGDHFYALYHGRWSEYHSSQSQADIALVNYISFYSRNPEQIRRVFLLSELGKRPKAHRAPSKNKQLGYLDEMIQKSFDNMAPEISIDELMGNLEKQLEEERERLKLEPTPMLGDGWELPPGLLGEMAKFIYEAAPRPVKEIALAAAIGLLAGIAGRAYNVTNTGLNQYILVLAPTGCGKEAAKSGMSRIIQKCIEQVPIAGDFIGPSSIASGSALLKYLTKNACFVSVLGEFGHTLQVMCSLHANGSEISKRQMLLDLYNKSGATDDVRPSIYSDKANNTEIVYSPAFTILAETTPDSYYPHVDELMVAQGLIPRFTCIEYTGMRPAKNEFHGQAVPTDEMIAKLVTVITNSLTLQQHKKVITVREDDPEAFEYMKAFDKYCDKKHHEAESAVAQHLWSRGDVKLRKLAALIAIGCHVYEPVITLEHAQWARKLIEADIINVINRFDSGRVGGDANEQAQVTQVISVIKDFILRPYDASLTNYSVDPQMHKDRVIPWSYLSRRLIQKPAFKKDRMGSTISMRRAVDALIADGALIEFKSHVMMERYKSTAKAYYVADLSRFSMM